MMDTKSTTSLSEAWAAHYRYWLQTSINTASLLHNPAYSVLKTSHFSLLAAAAQFLGADNMWGNRRARFGLRAKPQVHQHFLHEDTYHVDTDSRWNGNINTQCAGRSAAVFRICCGTTVGRGFMPLVFLYTHIRWISTNQRLNFFYILKFHVRFALGFFFFFNNIHLFTFGPIVVLLSLLYYIWDMVDI